jgi:hypothetical protein
VLPLSDVDRQFLYGAYGMEDRRRFRRQRDFRVAQLTPPEPERSIIFGISEPRSSLPR